MTMPGNEAASKSKQVIMGGTLGRGTPCSVDEHEKAWGDHGTVPEGSCRRCPPVWGGKCAPQAVPPVPSRVARATPDLTRPGSPILSPTYPRQRTRGRMHDKAMMETRTPGKAPRRHQAVTPPLIQWARGPPPSSPREDAAAQHIPICVSLTSRRKS